MTDELIFSFFTIFTVYSIGILIIGWGFGEEFGDNCWKCKIRMKNSREDVAIALKYREELIKRGVKLKDK
jgi:hypothetical protein